MNPREAVSDDGRLDALVWGLFGWAVGRCVWRVAEWWLLG